MRTIAPAETWAVPKSSRVATTTKRGPGVDGAPRIGCSRECGSGGALTERWRGGRYGSDAPMTNDGMPAVVVVQPLADRIVTVSQ